MSGGRCGIGSLLADANRTTAARHGTGRTARPSAGGSGPRAARRGQARLSAPADRPDPGPQARAGRALSVVGVDAFLALQAVVAGGAQRPPRSEPAGRGERPPARHALYRSRLVVLAHGIVLGWLTGFE